MLRSLANDAIQGFDYVIFGPALVLVRHLSGVRDIYFLTSDSNNNSPAASPSGQNGHGVKGLAFTGTKQQIQIAQHLIDFLLYKFHISSQYQQQPDAQHPNKAALNVHNVSQPHLLALMHQPVLHMIIDIFLSAFVLYHDVVYHPNGNIEQISVCNDAGRVDQALMNKFQFAAHQVTTDGVAMNPFVLIQMLFGVDLVAQHWQGPIRIQMQDAMAYPFVEQTPLQCILVLPQV